VVAVKVVTLGMAAAHRNEVLQEAGHEVEMLQRLHHPNIVTLFGMAVKHTSMDTKLMLVMECCTCSLKDCIEDRITYPTLLPIQVVRWLLDIARGMRYLHSHAVVHRDLKPGNVLMQQGKAFSTRESERKGESQRNGQSMEFEDSNHLLVAKVADFGGARFAEGTTAENSELTMTAGVGTPAYVAPEVTAEVEGEYSANSKYGNKVDVYSFALTAWACVHRATPFSDQNVSIWVLRTQISGGLRPTLAIPEEFLAGAGSSNGGVGGSNEGVGGSNEGVGGSNGTGASPSSVGLSSLEEIMVQGWNVDPKERPSFLEIEQCLDALLMAMEERERALNTALKEPAPGFRKVQLLVTMTNPMMEAERRRSTIA
jgi:serine/threonine protein kinase